MQMICLFQTSNKQGSLGMDFCPRCHITINLCYYQGSIQIYFYSYQQKLNMYSWVIKLALFGMLVCLGVSAPLNNLGYTNSGTGIGNTFTGTGNIWNGNYNNFNGNNNYAQGNQNDITGNKNLVNGFGNKVSGQGNVISGQGNIVISGSGLKGAQTQKGFNPMDIHADIQSKFPGLNSYVVKNIEFPWVESPQSISNAYNPTNQNLKNTQNVGGSQPSKNPQGSQSNRYQPSLPSRVQYPSSSIVNSNNYPNNYNQNPSSNNPLLNTQQNGGYQSFNTINLIGLNGNMYVQNIQQQQNNQEQNLRINAPTMQISSMLNYPQYQNTGFSWLQNLFGKR